FLRPPPPRGESVTLVVDFACADPVRDLLIRDDLFDVLGADYHTLARIEAPGFSGQFAFTPEPRETRVAVGGAGGGGPVRFGLLHGFGFSAALRELGLPSHGLLLSLFGFNAGVETGQALVVAVVLPLIVVLRRSRWEKRMVWSSSLAILLVGLVLFVERAFL